MPDPNYEIDNDYLDNPEHWNEMQDYLAKNILKDWKNCPLILKGN